MLMVIGSALAFVIILAFVAGQARLTLHAIRSGKAGWGKHQGDRHTSPVRYTIWIALYLVFLVAGVSYALVAIRAFML